MTLSLELFKRIFIVISISYNKVQITRFKWLFVLQQINGILLPGYDVILEAFLYLHASYKSHNTWHTVHCPLFTAQLDLSSAWLKKYLKSFSFFPQFRQEQLKTPSRFFNQAELKTLQIKEGFKYNVIPVE